MRTDHVAEILRATGSLRSGNPAGVTDIVRNALAIAGLPGPATAGAEGTSALHVTPQTTAAPRVGRPPRIARLRKPLGEVVRTLRAGKPGLKLDGLPGLPRPTPAPDLPLPEGAQFLDLRHVCPSGARRYRLYIPSRADEGLRGLVVMLHGCTQTPEDFAAGTGMNALAEKHRLLVVYPAQTGGDNAMSCWNWFRPEDQRRGAGEPAIIASLTHELRARYAIPEDRVFAAGLSAGGAMAAILAETYPELYAAVGIHSGLAYGSANDTMSAFAAMRGQPAVVRMPSPNARTGAAQGPRVIVFQGTADSTVHPSNAARIIAGKGAVKASPSAPSGGTRGYIRSVAKRADGTNAVECWMIDGAQHAWSGGSSSGSYTDPTGPDASAAMVHFFLQGRSDAPA
ncbi:esterase [Paracoccus suum]|uniref:Esterase n=1 Tax=Paracoccus suum TaxID=2259340 RepID=A0A344PMJ1_9RHOB|nr:PHB depolymerase family esterase [Paracoccus suum]AXC50596.1 esterase [Paracoccus suum]